MILFITLMSACSGGNDCDTCTGNGQDLDGDGVCNTCGDDTGTTPVASASFTAPKVELPDGTLEDCTANLVSSKHSYSVSSGNTENIVPGDYDLTYGDLALASEYSDSLPIHTASDGGTWILASQSPSIEDGDALAPESPLASPYIGGQTWTCNFADRGDSSTAQTDAVYYLNDDTGLSIALPSLGSVPISGNDLSTSSSDCTATGSFVSEDEIIYSWSCSFGHEDMQCWEGQFEDRP